MLYNWERNIIQAKFHFVCVFRVTLTQKDTLRTSINIYDWPICEFVKRPSLNLWKLILVIDRVPHTPLYLLPIFFRFKSANGNTGTKWKSFFLSILHSEKQALDHSVPDFYELFYWGKNWLPNVFSQYLTKSHEGHQQSCIQNSVKHLR